MNDPADIWPELRSRAETCRAAHAAADKAEEGEAEGTGQAANRL